MSSNYLDFGIVLGFSKSTQLIIGKLCAFCKKLALLYRYLFMDATHFMIQEKLHYNINLFLQDVVFTDRHCSSLMPCCMDARYTT